MECTCHRCGLKFQRRNSYASKRPIQFCGASCAILHRWDKSGRVERVKTQCQVCGKEIVQSKTKHQHYCSRGCSSRAHSARMTGSENSNYRGQAAVSLYRETKEVQCIRAMVMARDGNSCVVCGESEKRIHIHHLNEQKKDDRLENMVCLCIACHNSVHKTGGASGMGNSDSLRQLSRMLKQQGKSLSSILKCRVKVEITLPTGS